MAPLVEKNNHLILIVVKIDNIPTLTSYQQKFLAWQLDRRRSSSEEDKFTSVLAEAQVDLNPHQVDAAFFAFKSPLSMGAVLADEVGLCKTIEAALVISQHWAEARPPCFSEASGKKRQELFSLEDEIITRRDALIAAIDNLLNKAVDEELCSL